MVVSIILLLVGILFMVSGILSIQGKNFASFLHEKKPRKIIFIILGLFLLVSGIIYGVLIGKYKDDRFRKDRLLATCVKLSDLHSEEDVEKAFEKKSNLPTPEPTITMNINTAFAIMFSLGGLILMVIGSKSVRKYRKENKIGNTPTVVINLPGTENSAQVEEGQVKEVEIKSFVLAN
jgi:hypothetical protein